MIVRPVTQPLVDKSRNVVWHEHKVTRTQRANQKGQRPCVVWLTGLSGAGKSTLANALEQRLLQRGYHSYLLDGDNIRHGLSQDLGFSRAERVENIRRIGEVAALFVDAGLIVITAFISPFRADRALARALAPEGEFIEVYVRASLETCEQRDPPRPGPEWSGISPALIHPTKLRSGQNWCSTPSRIRSRLTWSGY